ncbi:MAG: type II toxin-antitoxin system RelE/ParE family toxin [Devosia sp.]|uniref:type II toxin-antitoxin system RelE/ParE family toxin n=1 Tax=Devosia sp. TaxID=1871048 RepID=UPI001A5E20F3|nr:type II toxin-antitoxin system RelE/ParE family toxin [Devosia sp.]MBL8596693.1 type II toxin-antitoxin system RelE/ParE family toxin [Devosia sp.]
MKRRSVTVDQKAKQDLLQIYHAIVLAGSPVSALAYLRRIEAFMQSLDLASERGTSLEEIDPGLRSIPFESVVLAVRVSPSDVVVVRVFHASQDWLRRLRREAAAPRRDVD